VRIALLALLAALTITWPAVTLDCLGGQESGVVYEIKYLWREGDARFFVCSEQAETQWTTAIGSPDPPLGAGYWYEIRDHDGAGNWSNGACEP